MKYLRLFIGIALVLGAFSVGRAQTEIPLITIWRQSAYRPTDPRVRSETGWCESDLV